MPPLRAPPPRRSMRKRRSGPERPTYRPPAAEVGRPRRDRRRMGQRFAAAPPISRFPFFWTCKVSGFGYLPRDFSTRGRSSTWLERRLVTPKVAGSSPVDPATGKPNLRAIGGFSLRGRRAGADILMTGRSRPRRLRRVSGWQSALGSLDILMTGRSRPRRLRRVSGWQSALGSLDILMTGRSRPRRLRRVSGWQSALGSLDILMTGRGSAW